MNRISCEYKGEKRDSDMATKVALLFQMNRQHNKIKKRENYFPKEPKRLVTMGNIFASKHIVVH